MAAYDQVTLIPIADIDVGERYRKTPDKNIDSLATSIDSLGLLHPIVVLAPNGDGRYPLVVGQRRMLASAKLGFDIIEARVVHDIDQADTLLAEVDENVCRQAMTPSEANACRKAREELLAPLAAERKTAGLKKGRSAPSRKNPTTGTETKAKPKPKPTRDAAAEGTGYSSRTLAKINKIEQWAFDPELSQEIQAYISGKLEELNKADKPKVDPVFREIEIVVNSAKTAAAQTPPEGDTAEQQGAEEGAEVATEPPYLDQAKVLKAALTAINKHANALSAAFVGAANLDPDTNPDEVSAGFKELRALCTSINKTAKAAAGIAGT